MGDPQSAALGELLSHRADIQRAVSEHLGRTWRFERVQDLRDRASHPAAVLSGGAYAVFAKLGQSEHAVDQFVIEGKSLALLTRLAGVLTPKVIACLDVDGGAILVLEAVALIEREALHWHQYGEALARMHAIQSDTFGFDTHSYWGDYRLDNSRRADWAEFFWVRHLEPCLREARDSGRLPAAIVREVEAIGARLASLCGPRVSPSLVHGDAHQNNVLATAQGPVFIDPATHYGHPETDLAAVDVFEPVSPELFRGYANVRPIDAGFDSRRELWRLPFHLAMIAVEGPQHVDRLRDALKHYA